MYLQWMVGKCIIVFLALKQNTPQKQLKERKVCLMLGLQVGGSASGWWKLMVGGHTAVADRKQRDQVYYSSQLGPVSSRIHPRPSNNIINWEPSIQIHELTGGRHYTFKPE